MSAADRLATMESSGNRRNYDDDEVGGCTSSATAADRAILWRFGELRNESAQESSRRAAKYSALDTTTGHLKDPRQVNIERSRPENATADGNAGKKYVSIQLWLICAIFYYLLDVFCLPSVHF